MVLSRKSRLVRVQDDEQYAGHRFFGRVLFCIILYTKLLSIACKLSSVFSLYSAGCAVPPVGERE